MKRGDDINLYSTEETSDIIRLSSSSDVVTMALQMSPVDAHSSVNLVDELLPALQASTTTTINIAGMSSQAELPQCQLMECSSAEQQVPLPIEQEPCSSLRGTEQNVTAALQEEEEEVDVMASALAKNEERRIPRDEELRGGAAPEILASLKVSQSSVIVSSKTAASLSSAEVSSVAGSHEAHPGSHESHLNLHPCRLVDVVKMDSAATSSSFSNSLNDAQKDVGDGLMNDGDPSPTRSVNQSTSTFSGETNHPSATYADSVLSTSSSPIPASSSLVSNLSSSFTSPPAHSAASAFDGDYCDSKETFDITLKSSSSISSRTSPLLHYTHPTGPASNRFWGIPQGAGLRGGAGETSLNNGAGTWGHPPASGTWGGGAPGGGAGPTGGSGTNNATNPVVQGQGWGSAGSSAAARSSAASQGPPGAPPPGSSGPQPISSNSQQLSAGGQQQQTPQGAWDQPKTVAQVLGSSPNQGVWAAQAAKNVPNQPTNPNQDIINAGPLNLPQGGNGGGGAMGGSGPATPSSGKPDPLANYREVIYSQDGWGGNQVNQDTQWDVPTSPEPKEIPLWKQTASNGTEVWEVNLRNGGLAPPPIPQTKTPWGSHTPATNLGGTWGEDDESAEPSSMWTGVPSNNGPNNWAGNPMGAPMGGGPMGGGPAPGGAPGMTGAGMSGPGMTGPGMAAGNGMWGGPKKEPEWAGNSNTMQAGPAGWGDIRPTQRIGMPGPETMGMGGPGAPSHWPGAQNKAVPGQWSGGVPPVKEMKPSGWDENSPPAQKRPIHNYDDGTAVWGNPTQQMQQQPGSRWKDMPNPNVAGGRGGMQQTGPPPGRMPPGPGMKTDMSWGGVGQTRNGSWGDGVSDQGTMWMDDKPMGVGTASWNEPPQTPTPWAKPKTPTTPSWGGGDNDDGSLSWGQPPKQMGPKPLAKEMIWASKQFRILSDMGFKKEDVENVLRNCNMVMEDALETLRSGRLGMFGEDHGGSGGGYDGMGPHGGGAPYPPTNRFNPAQQMPFGHPGGGGAAHHLLSNPSSGMGINPNQAYKILQPQQPPPMPPQVNPAQLVRNMGGRVDSGVSSGGGGSGTGSQPSPTQLRILVQQIQMAVQAGHLNPQILNQPLAPQTLVLLNQLLHQIKILQQLGQQHTMALGRPGGSGPGMMQLVPQMNKTKQQIASLQQQIAAQQALYVKQQGGGGGGMMNQQPPGAPPGSQGSELFKVDQVHNLQSNLERMNLQQDSGQSRLSQWKYPPMDSMDVSGMSDFSRAPGSIGGGAPPGNIKPPLGSSLSSPNMNPVLGQDGSAWGSLSRSQSETGWPDSGSDLPLGEGKDNWSSGATGTSSYSGSISDLVPEFEPGKPWKGPQIKTADDDPTLTPGTFAMSGLNNESDAYSNNGSKSGGNNPSSKSSPPPVSSSGGSSGGSSGSGGGFPTLGLSNSTWSFNPSSASSAATSSSGGAPYGSVAKSGPPKTTWSDAPPPLADPWSAPNKPRGPPPGITTASSGSQGSSGGSRSPWPGSGPSAGSSAGSWAGSLNGSSSWLVLRNLTPQIDGSTLKTLCVQHGPLHNFHLYLSHGVALVRYSTGEEAAKAQSALNNCVLGNTTIYADLANESDVQGWLQQLGMPTQQQQQQQQPGSSSGGNWGVRGSTPGAGGNGTSGGNGNGGGSGGNTGKASANSAGDNNWGASGAGGGSGGGGGGGGGPTSSSPWSTGPSSVWSTPSLDREMRTTPSSLNASLNSFLPGDLLGNESM